MLAGFFNVPVGPDVVSISFFILIVLDRSIICMLR